MTNRDTADASLGNAVDSEAALPQNQNEGAGAMLINNFDDDKFVDLVDRFEFLWWGIEGKWHVVGTRHFFFRIETSEVDENEAAWELFGYLESKFERTTPQQGQTLVYNHGVVKPGTHYAKGFLGQFLDQMPSKKGTITPYLYANDSFRYRWIKFNGFNVYANDEYISLIHDGNGVEVHCDGPEKTLYLYNGDLIILPVKNVSEKACFDDLEEALLQDNVAMSGGKNLVGPQAIDPTESTQAKPEAVEGLGQGEDNHER